jgi:hypothetical protein|tara:strand:- start:164 stop:412 length:249 start_codon:yes stop_codon:yes gene_type:complete
MKNQIKLPINGLWILDNENVRVKSNKTGITKWLTPEEVTVYDYINGSYTLSIPNETNFYKCIDWFRKNNLDAYEKVIKEFVA